MILPALPAEAAPLLLALQPAFTQPTWQRFALLMVAAVLTTSRCTVANLLRTAGPLASGHKTGYQRVLSAASWSGLHLACLPTGSHSASPTGPSFSSGMRATAPMRSPASPAATGRG